MFEMPLLAGIKVLTKSPEVVLGYKIMMHVGGAKGSGYKNVGGLRHVPIMP